MLPNLVGRSVHAEGAPPISTSKVCETPSNDSVTSVGRPDGSGPHVTLPLADVACNTSGPGTRWSRSVLPLQTPFELPNSSYTNDAPDAGFTVTSPVRRG